MKKYRPSLYVVSGIVFFHINVLSSVMFSLFLFLWCFQPL